MDPSVEPLRHVTLLSNRRATPTSRLLRIGGALSYRAGQAAWLAAEPDADLTPYSIASSPEETARFGWLEFLVKVDGSSRFGGRVTSLRRGAPIVMRAPLGSFVFPDEPHEHRYLFVAGGTGIAPLRSMIRHAIDTHVPGAFRLLYAARTRAEFAYLTELRALERARHLEIVLTLTGSGSRWPHARGRPDASLLAPLVDTPDTLCFVCGPPAMLISVSDTLQRLGVPADRIRSEIW